MEWRGINRKKFLIRTIYYAVTFLCVGVLAGALRSAYQRSDISVAVWVLIYILVVAYMVGGVILTIRLKRGTHKVAAHSLAMQLLPLCVAITLFSTTSKEEIKRDNTTREVKVIAKEDSYQPILGKPSTYERSFNDMQDKQKKAALLNGLPTFKSRAQIEEQYKKLRRSNKLVLIESNSKYIVRDLTYSSPYVVPKVEELLNDIAERFQQKTQSKSRFMVTSVLRTEEDIAKLRRVNGNASAASCHCNATTIDISYVRFDKDESRPREDYQLRMALAQTMHELRKEGRCYIKIERKQYCYHITVR